MFAVRLNDDRLMSEVSEASQSYKDIHSSRYRTDELCMIIKDVVEFHDDRFRDLNVPVGRTPATPYGVQYLLVR